MDAAYIKNNAGYKIFDFLNILFMLLFTFIMIYPFINLMAISFNEGYDAVRGGIYFIPRVFSLESYDFVFKNESLLKGTLVSVMRVVVGVSTSLLVTGLLSYIITIKRFSGRRFVRIVFIITMYFGGGLIPFYLLILKLHLNESFHVYWIPALISPYYMLLMASFMQELPESLGESARLDGSNELGIYFRIIMPLSLPVFAAVAIYCAVGQWNSWFDTALFNPGRKWDTLQIILNRLLNSVEALQEISDVQTIKKKYMNMTPVTVRAAITVIVTLPIVLVYPFFQKYFIGGLTIGSVKG